MRQLVFSTALLAIVLPSAALAQQGTVTGAAGGAATGAVIGGPVGAAVGGVAGAVVGTVLAPPPAVKTYVIQEQQPSVVVQQPVVVGQPLPEEVDLYPVPNYDAYDYAVVNNQRVIVDARTRKVIEVVQ